MNRYKYIPVHTRMYWYIHFYDFYPSTCTCTFKYVLVHAYKQVLGKLKKCANRSWTQDFLHTTDVQSHCRPQRQDFASLSAMYVIITLLHRFWLVGWAGQQEQDQGGRYAAEQPELQPGHCSWGCRRRQGRQTGSEWNMISYLILWHINLWYHVWY